MNDGLAYAYHLKSPCVTLQTALRDIHWRGYPIEETRQTVIIKAGGAYESNCSKNSWLLLGCP